MNMRSSQDCRQLAAECRQLVASYPESRKALNEGADMWDKLASIAEANEASLRFRIARADLLPRFLRRGLGRLRHGP